MCRCVQALIPSGFAPFDSSPNLALVRTRQAQVGGCLQMTASESVARPLLLLLGDPAVLSLRWRVGKWGLGDTWAEPARVLP